MEITLKVVLSADANFLAALQALAGQKLYPVTQSMPFSEMKGNGETGTNGEDMGVKPEKRIRKIKTGGDIPNISNAESAAIENGGTEDAKTNGVKVETTHTLDSLREIAVPLSKAGHKDAIKEKISSFGYESIAFMEPKDFDAFYAFLQTLN